MILNLPLTVLIPTFNPEVHLGLLIIKIAQASKRMRTPIRVEISDDRSKTALRLPAIDSKEFPNLTIRVHTNIENLGEASNVNQAMIRLAAEGHDWVLLMHQDDLMLSQWLVLCQEYAATWSPGKPEMVFPENQGVYHTETISEPIDITDCGFENIPAHQEGLDYVSQHWHWIPSGTLFKSDTYNRMYGFHPTLRYAGDNDFMVRWLLSGKTVRHYRHKFIFKLIHAGSSTSRCVLNGWDNECWGYLMQRYASHRTAKGNRQAHYSWLYRNLRMAITSLRLGDPLLFWTRVIGVSIALRSFAATYFPSSLWLLPRKIRILLNEAPPIRL